MKNIRSILIRSVVLLGAVFLITALGNFINGGRTARSLSDTLVYVSFVVLAVGTITGINRFGYKGQIKPGDPPDDLIPGLLHDLFRAGPFGIALTLAGIWCFVLAIIVDLVF
jgi:hypothetical protein